MQSWLVRTFRGRRLDKNPLRRPSDRAETVIGLFLLVALIAALPFTVRAAAVRTYAMAHRARVAALVTRHPVTAITLQPAPAQSRTPYSLISRPWISAKWPAPAGPPRTGRIQVVAGTPQGAPEPIWITKSGRVAAAPLQMAEVSEMAGLAATCAVLALFAGFGLTWAAVRGFLNHRRMAAWTTDWAAAESRWNRQRW